MSQLVTQMVPGGSEADWLRVPLKPGAYLFKGYRFVDADGEVAIQIDEPKPVFVVSYDYGDGPGLYAAIVDDMTFRPVVSWTGLWQEIP